MELEVSGTPYLLFPPLNILKFKRVKFFTGRPRNHLSVKEAGCLDFDEASLPEDRWERLSDEDNFEVEKIIEV